VGLSWIGTLTDIYQGRVVKGVSSDMAVTFGQGFGRNEMDEYMPLWFELGIPGPDALVSPVRIGREKGTRGLISVSNFQKEYGSVGNWKRKAVGKPTQVHTQALKRLYQEHCEGSEVLAGNTGAEKWTSKERRLSVLPEHWVVAGSEALLMAWADRGGHNDQRQAGLVNGMACERV
jgi:hypothetical protein